MSGIPIRHSLQIRDWEIRAEKIDGRIRYGVWRIKDAPVVKPPVVITDPDLLERMRKDALKAERRAPFLLKLREDLAP